MDNFEDIAEAEVGHRCKDEIDIDNLSASAPFTNGTTTMTTEQKYKAIKKKLGMSDEEISQMFGYKNVTSFHNAKGGKEKVVNGVVALFDRIAFEFNKQHNDFFTIEDKS